MSILKFNPTTNEFTNGKVDLTDCNFTLPSQTLPITLATAFVDAEYPDTPPYFSNYENGAAWVESRVIAGAGTGNIIITSDQADCNLINNVNIWLAPSVTINSFTGSDQHDIYIDGLGIINNLTLKDCGAVQCKARKITGIEATSSNAIKIFSNETVSTSVYIGNDIDLNFYGSAGSLSIGGEALVELTGTNAVFNSISIIDNSSLRARNIRLLGLFTDDTTCFTDFEGCEFYTTNGYAIESKGNLSLTNCWVCSNSVPIRTNNGSSGLSSLVLNNTIIYSGGNYSIYNASTGGKQAPVHVYGGCCSNKNMYNCYDVVQTITVNSDLKYRAY